MQRVDKRTMNFTLSENQENNQQFEKDFKKIHQLILTAKKFQNIKKITIFIVQTDKDIEDLKKLFDVKLNSLQKFQLKGSETFFSTKISLSLPTMVFTNWYNLKHLVININKMNNDDLSRLMKEKFKLIKIDLSCNSINGLGLSCFLNKENLNKLQFLNLSVNKINYSGIKTLIKCQFQQLRKLNLSNNSLCGSAVSLLTKGIWKRLIYLKVLENDFDDEAIKIAFTKSNWKEIEFLSIKNKNQKIMSFEGIKHVVKLQSGTLDLCIRLASWVSEKYEQLFQEKFLNKKQLI